MLKPAHAPIKKAWSLIPTSNFLDLLSSVAHLNEESSQMDERPELAYWKAGDGGKGDAYHPLL